MAGNNSEDGDVNAGDGRNLALDVVVVAVTAAEVAAAVGLIVDHLLQGPS